ncbi:MAG TPA: hypothetical protein DEP42_07280 [Ruminococcaceae bacterium]|nr:hypothetical protein [Oscillospiraceae bacterium]
MEMIDIRDSEGKPTGRTVPRSHVLVDDEFMLAVHIFIYRQDHRFLLQKRSLQKRLYPGKWDVTGGGVQAGEDSLHAALREVKEEVGLTLAPKSLIKLTRLKRAPVFFDVWICQHEFSVDELKLQEEEVDAVKLVTSDEMLTTLFDKEFPDPGYREVVASYIRKL